MEKLRSAFSSFYTVSDTFSFTINFEVTLLEPIHKEALRRAIDQAQVRFPYFSVRVVVADDQYALEPNDAPFVIFDKVNDAVLGSPEANHHLLAFAVHDCTMSFLMFHGLADGNGMFPFMKTVLYLYLSEVTGKRLDAGTVRLPGEPVLAPEFVDPWPASIPDSIQPFGLFVPQDAFQLPEIPPASQETATAFEITLPEDAFMRYTRQADGSPATMVSAFVFKVIQSVHPENTDPICCGMAFDPRGVLGVPETYFNCASLLHLGYEPNMVALPMTKLATISRGMVFLQSQPENTLVGIRSHMMAQERFLALSHEERKELMAQRVGSALSTDTFSVSYVGQWHFGDLDPYIASMHPYTSINGMGFLVEITAIHGHFELTWMQNFKSSRYVDRFCELLAEEGVTFEVSEPYIFEVPGMMLDS